MPQNSQIKASREHTALRDACIKTLSEFGSNGTTVDVLVSVIRDHSELATLGENSPVPLNGEQAIKALLQQDPKFELVGKTKFRLAQKQTITNGGTQRSTPKKGQKRELGNMTPSQSQANTPTRITRQKSQQNTPVSGPRKAASPAKDSNSSQVASPKPGRKALPASGKPSTSPSKGSAKASAVSMKSPSKKQEQNDDPAAAEEAAVLAAAISFVSTKMTRLEGTVETAKINVQDSIAKASADASAGDPDACAEPQGMDILSLDPSSIDVEFIEKATSLPQEILDEVPPGLRQFMGRPDDRKALMAFKRQRTKEIRRIIQAAQKKAAAAKKSMINTKEVVAAKRALAKQEALMRASQRHLAALKAGGLAELRRVAPVSDHVRIEAAAKKAVEKATQQRDATASRAAAKVAKGEQRKTEGKKGTDAQPRPRLVMDQLQVDLKAAEQHPMDDQALLLALKKTGAEHAATVALPVEPLSERDSKDEMLTLYVAEFLHTFQKPLDLPRLPLLELRQALTGDAEATSTALLRQTLFQLTTVIIEDLMENEKPSRQDKRWRAALGAGTWPEVLRRYILTRLVQADPPLASMEAAQGAYAISTLGFDGLPPRQKLSFLAAVCDEVLDTKTMRDELQDRADRVEQVSKDTRAICMEERRKLRELQEKEREMRKQHREELLALLGTDASGAAAGAAPEGKGKGGKGPVDADSSAEAGGGKGPSATSTNARRRQMDAAEKGMALKVAKAKAACEDAVAKAETRLEQAVKRHGNRGAKAGHDRRWLPVWHRVAGEKNVVIAADDAGTIAVLHTQEDVGLYCEALDTRGARESALHSALQATLPSLVRQNAKTAAPREEPVRVLPKRQSREVAAAMMEQQAQGPSARKPAAAPAAAFAPFAMEAQAIKSFSTRFQAATEALLAKEGAVTDESAVRRAGEEVGEACAVMLLENSTGNCIAELRTALRTLETAVNEACLQQPRKQLHRVSEEVDAEMNDAEGEEDEDNEEEEQEDEEEEEDSEEEEEEEETQQIEAVMQRCAAALVKRGAMPSQRDLCVLAAGADFTHEVYEAARWRHRPWWGPRERRVWQREADDAGTPAAMAYLLSVLLNSAKRVVNSA